MKFYRKQPLEAEQFDGSEAMIEKYSIRLVTLYQIAAEPDEFEYVPFMIETLEAWVTIEVGDWIATGVNGERWAVTDEIFKQTYQALPAIPEGVALYISDLKSGLSDMGENVNLAEAIIAAVDYDQASDVIIDWIKAHGNEFSRAWLDGYKVETKS